MRPLNHQCATILKGIEVGLGCVGLEERTETGRDILVGPSCLLDVLNRHLKWHTVNVHCIHDFNNHSSVFSSLFGHTTPLRNPAGCEFIDSAGVVNFAGSARRKLCCHAFLSDGFT